MGTDRPGGGAGTKGDQMLDAKSVRLVAWLREHEQTLAAIPETPLPDFLRAKMEAFFATSFADVYIKITPLVAQLGALACACGSTLLVAPEHYDPHSVSGQTLIGHELAHVVQQRAGRISSPQAGPILVSDAQLEAEADRLGALAALSSISTHHHARIATRQVHFATPETVQIFQLKVEILADAKASPSDRKSKRRILKSVNEATQGVQNLSAGYRDVLREQIAYFNMNRQGCTAILSSWISEGNYDLLGLFFLHTRTYRDYGELLRAAVAEHAAQANLQKENALAQEVYRSEKLKKNLAKALKAIHTKIESLDQGLKAKILGELSSFSCAYWTFYRLTWSCRNIAYYINQPNKDWVDCNIAIYHDLMQYFVLDDKGQPIKRFPEKTAGHALNLREDERYAMGTYEDIGITDEEWDKIGKDNIDLDEVRRRGQKFTVKKSLGDDYRNTLSSANEGKLVTQTLRENDLPMWASHSWTTLRMLVLANWASGQGNLDQHEAVAWAIFALWNTSGFLQFGHPIHRFHEVMDIASNFGVPYQHLKYPAHAPT